MTVYDVAGRRVATLAAGHHRAATHRITWDGRDGRGRATAAGIYFVRLVAGDASITRKIILLH